MQIPGIVLEMLNYSIYYLSDHDFFGYANIGTEILPQLPDGRSIRRTQHIADTEPLLVIIIFV